MEDDLHAIKLYNYFASEGELPKVLAHSSPIISAWVNFFQEKRMQDLKAKVGHERVISLLRVLVNELNFFQTSAIFWTHVYMYDAPEWIISFFAEIISIDMPIWVNKKILEESQVVNLTEKEEFYVWNICEEGLWQCAAVV